MKITEIRYKHTMNLGNYESSSFEMAAELTDDESLDEAVMSLIEHVHETLDAIKEARDE